VDATGSRSPGGGGGDAPRRPQGLSDASTDEARLNHAHDQSREQLVNLTRRLLGIEAAAEDAVQAGYTKCLEKCRQSPRAPDEPLFRDEQAARNYLFQVTIRCALDQLRERKRRPATELVDDIVDPGTSVDRLLATDHLSRVLCRVPEEIGTFVKAYVLARGPHPETLQAALEAFVADPFPEDEDEDGGRRGRRKRGRRKSWLGKQLVRFRRHLKEQLGAPSVLFVWDRWKSPWKRRLVALVMVGSTVAVAIFANLLWPRQETGVDRGTRSVASPSTGANPSEIGRSGHLLGASPPGVGTAGAGKLATGDSVPAAADTPPGPSRPGESIDDTAPIAREPQWMEWRLTGHPPGGFVTFVGTRDFASNGTAREIDIAFQTLPDPVGACREGGPDERLRSYAKIPHHCWRARGNVWLEVAIPDFGGIPQDRLWNTSGLGFEPARAFSCGVESVRQEVVPQDIGERVRLEVAARTQRDDALLCLAARPAGKERVDGRGWPEGGVPFFVQLRGR